MKTVAIELHKYPFLFTRMRVDNTSHRPTVLTEGCRRIPKATEGRCPRGRKLSTLRYEERWLLSRSRQSAELRNVHVANDVDDSEL